MTATQLKWKRLNRKPSNCGDGLFAHVVCESVNGWWCIVKCEWRKLNKHCRYILHVKRKRDWDLFRDEGKHGDPLSLNDCKRIANENRHEEFQAN